MKSKIELFLYTREPNELPMEKFCNSNKLHYNSEELLCIIERIIHFEFNTVAAMKLFTKAFVNHTINYHSELLTRKQYNKLVKMYITYNDEWNDEQSIEDIRYMRPYKYCSTCGGDVPTTIVNRRRRCMNCDNIIK